MITAAKKLSQVGTHMAIAFVVVYLVTGSVAVGGLAAIAEPVVNVLLLPFHERVWQRLHARFATLKQRYIALAAQKISQTVLHMAVAFAVMYWATGSVAFGGLAAVLEPICNVIALPFHDRFWDRLQRRLTQGSNWAAA